MFKPRIFISSTFTENEKLRNQIKKYFQMIGGEPLLYETTLTPSTIPFTYRQDIQDADFVLLILKNSYGTETSSGMSGIHEEYKIAKEHNIPTHVYIKKDASDDNELIRELKADYVSYYYFLSDRDLLNRIKETTFTIAKEIILNQIVNSNIEESLIQKLAYDNDYKKGMVIISIVENMKRFNKAFDYMRTNVLAAFLVPVLEDFYNKEHYFINCELDKYLGDVLSVASSFLNKHGLDYTINGHYKEYEVEELGSVMIAPAAYSKNTEYEQEDYENDIALFFENYNQYKTEISKIKIEADLIK